MVRFQKFGRRANPIGRSLVERNFCTNAQENKKSGIHTLISMFIFGTSSFVVFLGYQYLKAEAKRNPVYYLSKDAILTSRSILYAIGPNFTLSNDVEARIDSVNGTAEVEYEIFGPLGSGKVTAKGIRIHLGSSSESEWGVTEVTFEDNATHSVQNINVDHLPTGVMQGSPLSLNFIYEKRKIILPSLAVVGSVAVVALTMRSKKNHSAYRESIKMFRGHVEAIRAIGAPVRFGKPEGKLDTHFANFHFLCQGPLGRGRIYCQAIKTQNQDAYNQKWTWSQLELRCDDHSKPKINMLKTQDKEHTLAPQKKEE